MLEMSASESLYGGQFTLSTQSIKPNYFVIFPPVQHHSFFRNLAPLYFFTTITVNLAIWFANLPLSIRVHNTLLASMCCAMPFSACALKKRFLWCCGKKQIEMWFILVCAVIGNEYKSLLFSQTFFPIVSACWASLQKERKVRKVWCV